MENRNNKYFLIFTIFFYTVIIIFSVFITVSEYKNNISTAQISFNQLSNTASLQYSSNNDFSSDFSDIAISFFNNNHQFKSVIVSGKDNAVHYLFVKDRSILASEPDISLDNITTPEYKENLFFYHFFSETVSAAEKETLKIEASFQGLTNAFISEIIKYLIIFILIYIIFSVIFLICMQEKRKITIKADISEEEAEESKELLTHNLSSDNTEKTLQTKTDDFMEYSANPQTGLGWYEFLSRKLDYELDKAGSFDNDLTLALINYFYDSSINEKEITGTIIQLSVKFASKDLIFEYKLKNSIAVILPDTNIEDGIAKINAFIIRLKQITGVDIVYAGLSSRNSRLLSEKRLVKEAEGALSKAISEPDSPVIAFRSDPDKYRQILSSQQINSLNR